MRKVILYIAMSLDGYIADKLGNVNWLKGEDETAEDIDTYSDFIQKIDTVVMGWNTYHQIITELSPNQWVYSEQTSYVITHRILPSTDNIKFVQESPVRVVQKLKAEQGQGIWICGGGSIIHPLMDARMIDEYHISIIPTILGSGIRLFEEMPKEIKLRLMHTCVCNGITELVYQCR